MKIRAATAIAFVTSAAPAPPVRRPARRHTTSRRKPPSTTMTVCTSFPPLALNAGHFLQVATMAIGHRVMSHLLFGSVAEHVHAVSRGLASFAPGHSSGWLRAYGGG